MNQKNYRCFLVLLFTLSMFWSCTGVAVMSMPLYSVKVPVQTMLAKERNDALPNALKTVLVRVSGDSQIDQNSQIADMLNNPNQYVSEYSYQKADLGMSIPWVLVVNFTPSAINQTLTQQKFSIWSKERPLMLVWLAIKDSKGTTLMAGDSKVDAMSLIQHDADWRGLPIVFPLLDFMDKHRVSANDVWTSSVDKIKKASARYNPDEILITTIDETNATAIAAHWLLLSQDQQMHWETDGNQLSGVIAAGINNVADALAQQFVGTHDSAAPETAQAVQVVVMNLHDVGYYAKVM